MEHAGRPTRSRPNHPDQGLLLPPDMWDWTPAFSGTRERSGGRTGSDAALGAVRGRGRRKSLYEPQMMLRVLICGYVAEVVSYPGLARRLQEDVVFRILAVANFSSHRTTCEYRRRHFGVFKRLFVQVVRLARPGLRTSASC